MTEHPTRHEKQPWWYIALIVVLVLALGATLFSLVSTFRQYRASGVLPAHLHTLHRLPTTPTTIDTIDVWMTFDYLNHVFKLQPDVLKTSLSITDTNYPRISIGHYGRDNNLSGADAVAKVKAALHTAIGS